MCTLLLVAAHAQMCPPDICPERHGTLLDPALVTPFCLYAGKRHSRGSNLSCCPAVERGLHRGWWSLVGAQSYCWFEPRDTAGDGNSMSRDCGGSAGDGVSCIPGCAPVGHQCLKRGCHCWDCSFPPAKLREALQTQLDNGVPKHNELVIDTRSVRAYLPHAVLAFFVEKGADPTPARRARSAFVAAYGLADEEVAPVLQLDLQAPAPLSYG
jgi:hypothetical protein